MYDLVGGGFHRYSVDDRWLVPHFEKMLYDNALLASAYLHAWVVTGEPSATARSRRRRSTTSCANCACRTAGLASAQDADTNGVEGLTFTWTEDEGVPGGAAAALRGRPLDHPRRPDRRTCARGCSRSERSGPQPGLTTRCSPPGTAWPSRRSPKAHVGSTGPTGSAPPRGLGEFLLGPLSRENGGSRSWREGKVSGEGFLDDYANVAHGMIELHVATGESRWLEEAQRLAALAIELFHDPRQGGFFLAPAGGEELVARTKGLDDNPIPSGNSMLAHVLVRLGRIWGDDELGSVGVSVLRLVEPMLAGHPVPSAGPCAHSTSGWRHRARSRSPGPSTAPSPARPLLRLRPTRSSPSVRRPGFPCSKARRWSTASPPCTLRAIRLPGARDRSCGALGGESDRLVFQAMTTIEQTGAEDVAWDLSDLYASGDDPRIESDIAEAEEAAVAFRTRYYGKVATLSAAGLADAIDERERIESIATRALYYAHLRFSTNMADPARGALVSKLGEKAAGLETQLLFFGLEWAAIEDDPAELLLADAALDHWRHWLSAQRVFRPYLLTEPEEKIIRRAVSASPPGRGLYEEVLGACASTSTAKPRPVSARVRRWRSCTRPTAPMRLELQRPSRVSLGPVLRTRTSIFDAVLVDEWIDDRLRGYSTSISSATSRTNDRRRRPGADRCRHLPVRRSSEVLPAQGEDARPREARVLRPLRARGRLTRRRRPGRGAQHRRRGLRRLLERGRGSGRRFFDDALMTRRSDPTSAVARSAPPTSRVPIRTCSSITQSPLILALAHELRTPCTAPWPGRSACSTHRRR